MAEARLARGADDRRILTRVTARPPASDEYFSRFGGLWTDRLDADAEIDRRAARDELHGHAPERFREFVRNGYAVIEHAVDPDICDRVREDIDREWHRDDTPLRVTPPGSIASEPLGPWVPRDNARVVDAYVHLDSARRALFSAPIVSFLRAIFEEDPLLFQSLSFPKGSQQTIHQDTAYVVTSSPLAMAGVWIALEDIQAGSGELIYYRGSHRLPEHLFSGQYKHWDSLRDGFEQHDDWIIGIQADAQRLGLPLERFRPKQGTALVWAAELAHGGAEIERADSTRHSLVGHYCPRSVDPHYFTHQPDRAITVPYDRGWYSSYHCEIPPSTPATPRWRRSLGRLPRVRRSR
jgi:phytanoyl-CoA hydroxylase